MFAFLSFPFVDDILTPGGHRALSAAGCESLEIGHSDNTSFCCSARNHADTYVDFPGHMIVSQKVIGDLSFNYFIFEHRVLVDIPEQNPELSTGALVPEGTEAHKISFARTNTQPVLLIEDLNLALGLPNPRRLIVAPMLIAGLDSSPCTVIAKL